MLTAKEKSQALARWLLPQYIESGKIDAAIIASVFGKQLIARLGLRALNGLVAEMQYTLAGIEETTE